MMPSVRGSNILAMLAAMGPLRPTGERILADHGIADVVATDWYALGDYTTALRTIADTLGQPALVQIGMHLADHLPCPPGLDTFDAVMGCVGSLFSETHRDASPGDITFQLTGAASGTIVSATPYPCDFERGAIVGRFERSLDARVTVTHDPRSGCRSTGGATCTYLIARGSTT